MTPRSKISSFTISVALWFVILVGAAMGQSILEGAKKEGQVVLYASMEAVSAQKIVVAFEKKYPFIKVDATRIGSERMGTRLVAEAHPGKVPAHVVPQYGSDFSSGITKRPVDRYFSLQRPAHTSAYRNYQGASGKP